MKNRSKGIKRNVAKILLNSPYGKTAMNGLMEHRDWILDESGSVRSIFTGYYIDDNVYQYLPIAIAITAGARGELLTAAYKIGFNHVHYMDTDSIKYDASVDISNLEINIHDSLLGYWKVEGHPELFKTIAPKKYVYWEHEIIKYTCAGIGKPILERDMKHNQPVSRSEAIILMNKFDSGITFTDLQSKVVKGGRALIPIEKKLS